MSCDSDRQAGRKSVSQSVCPVRPEKLPQSDDNAVLVSSLASSYKIYDRFQSGAHPACPLAFSSTSPPSKDVTNRVLRCGAVRSLRCTAGRSGKYREKVSINQSPLARSGLHSRLVQAMDVASQAVAHFVSGVFFPDRIKHITSHRSPTVVLKRNFDKPPEMVFVIVGSVPQQPAMIANSRC